MTAQFRQALALALHAKRDPAGCTQRQGVPIRDSRTGRVTPSMQPCAVFWPLRPDRWCRSCLLEAAVEELRQPVEPESADEEYC